MTFNVETPEDFSSYYDDAVYGSYEDQNKIVIIKSKVISSKHRVCWRILSQGINIC